MRSVVGLLLVGASLVGWAGPSYAMDADHRLGRPDAAAVVPGTDLLAPMRPQGRCLRVRVVPVATGAQRDLLLVPCRDLVRLPEPRPWGDRPPIVIPVAPPR